MNILLTCIGNKFPIVDFFEKTVAKKKNKSKLFISDANDKILITKLKKKIFFKLPNLISQNLKTITKILLQKKIDLVIPTSDKELQFWSKNKNYFLDKGIKVIVSELETIKICQDKFIFYQYLKDKKLPHIKTYLKYKNEEKRLLVKERYSFTKKDINLINLKESKNLTYYKSPIFQEIIKNYLEYSADIFVYKNQKNISIRQRKYVVNGESKLTSKYQNNILEKKIMNILNNFKLEGFINFQFFFKKGKLYPIEINPRIGGASIHSYFIYRNYVQDLIDLVNNKKINNKKQKLRNITIVRLESDIIYT